MTCEMCGCRRSSWSSADDDDVGIDGRRLKTIASVRFRVRAGPVRGDRHGVLLKCVPKSPGDLVKNFTKSSRMSLRLCAGGSERWVQTQTRGARSQLCKEAGLLLPGVEAPFLRH